MNVLIVDDNKIVLEAETAAIKRVMPDANIYSVLNASEAIQLASDNMIDIVFLETKIKGMSGLKLAEKLNKYNSKLNIIFCTNFEEYALEAHELYCSAYLMKPITDEKIRKALDNLRYQ